MFLRAVDKFIFRYNYAYVIIYINTDYVCPINDEINIFIKIAYFLGFLAFNVIY